MDCLQAEEHFSAHFEDTLDYETLRDLEAHLAVCETCQQEYTRFQASLKAVQQLPQIEPSPYFMPALLQRMAEERQERGVNAVATWWALLLATFRRPAWAFSGVMAVVLAITGAYFYQAGFLLPGGTGTTTVEPQVQTVRAAPSARRLPIGDTGRVRRAIQNGTLPAGVISAPVGPTQQRYVLKKVSYTGASTRGGL